MNAAVLLRSVAHWQRYAEIERDGHLWNVNSREWWADETGMSFDQTKRALRFLREEGLIRTGFHKWGSPTRNQLHIRLSDEARTELGIAPL